MGDVSMIARRLEGGKYVQYGWGGNGGYFRNNGFKLLCWYDDPELVEYLFSLGQFQMIGKPGSEKGGEPWYNTHMLDGVPHWLGKSEREIFSQIAFADYGYFYDTDNTWYYIIPGSICIKVPLAYIAQHLDKNGDEFEELNRLSRRVAENILGDFYDSDQVFRTLIDQNYSRGIDAIRQTVLADESYPSSKLWNYQAIYNYIDDWVVVKTSEDMKEISGIVVRKNQRDLGANRVETIDWV